MNPTIKEIAKKADVSIATVSRVLNNDQRVTEKTRNIVLKVSEELNYKPNILARGLSRTKTCNIAVIIPQLAQDGKYWELPTKGIDKAQEGLYTPTSSSGLRMGPPLIAPPRAPRSVTPAPPSPGGV